MKRGKQNKKILITALALILSTAFIAIIINAAFIGGGSKKGVAVSNEYFFTSNILSQLSDPSQQLPSYTCIEALNPETILEIQIKNYNSTMNPTGFDITYNLQFWAEGADSTNYSYSIKYTDDNGQLQSFDITANKQEITNIVLPASKIKSNSFTVSFKKNVQTAKASDANKICVLAVPTSPNAMSSSILGACITLSDNQTEFSATVALDGNNTDSITDYAGFIYNFSTTGYVEQGKTSKIKIIWDSTLFDIDINNPKYILGAQSVVNETVNNHIIKTITVAIDTDQYFPVAFYRTDIWSNTPPAAATIEELKLLSLVKVEAITE